MDKAQIDRITSQIRNLLSSQKLAVLSTHSNGAPYASLVAYTADDALDFLLFATPRTTRKFANLSAEPRVALLVHNSRNEPGDFHEASEGLGILMQLPVDPGKKEADQLLDHLKRIKPLIAG